MRHLTDERPKCLLEVKGRPLIEWQLEALRSAGIQQIGIVTGYRSELLSAIGLPTFHNSRWAETNMVSSLACASPWLASHPCLVSYSDIFYGREAVKTLCAAAPGPLAISYDPNWLTVWQKRFANPLDDAETFRVDETGRVLEIGKRPLTLEEIQGQYMGLLRFTPAGWSAVESMRAGLDADRRDRIDMTSTLQALIEQGFPVHAAAVTTSWGEFDSSEDFAQLD